MKELHKNIFWIFFLLLCSSVNDVHATHAAGGTISYRFLGGNLFEVELIIYRDCSPGTASVPSSRQLYAIDSSRTDVISRFTFDEAHRTIETVDITTGDPCMIDPGGCIEKVTFLDTISLAPISGGYILKYVLSARSNDPINIPPGETNGFAAGYEVVLPDHSTLNNNSPVFNLEPPTVMCVNNTFTADLSAVDPDGDVLEYEFVDVLDHSVTWPENVGVSIPWNPGYSVNNQIDASVPFTLDLNTGILSGTPSLLGTYTLSYKVSEYRGGVLLSTVNRDFMVSVTNCAVVQPSFLDQDPMGSDPYNAIGIPLCGGLIIPFTNTTVHSNTTFLWDFGVPSTTLDTSTLEFPPSYTYPDTGKYLVTLYTNPGVACKDSFSVEIDVQYPIGLDFSTGPLQCVNNNSYNFWADPSGVVYPNTAYEWTFGPDGVVNDSSTLFSFNTPGTHNVVLTAQHGKCLDSAIHPVTIIDGPFAVIDPIPNCNGTTVAFNHSSVNANGGIEWRMGDGTVYSYFPTSGDHTYTTSGTYNIELIAFDATCPDTARLTVDAFDGLEVEIDVLTDSIQCFNGNNSFSLEAVGSFDPATTDLSWDFGGLGAYSDTTLSTVQVDYLTQGIYNVVLEATSSQCPSAITKSTDLIIGGKPVADFTVLGDSGCPGNFESVFADQSTIVPSESIVVWEWDFGDGSYASNQNPSKWFDNLSNTTVFYDVSLTVTSSFGCMDTIIKSQEIKVFGRAVADFLINPSFVDVDDPFIVSDLSDEFARQYTDLTNGVSLPSDPFEHILDTPGTYPIEQVVFNADGCSDTIVKNVFVNPKFYVYVPNSFTPNGDNLNDAFLPQIVGVSDYQLLVFDRWGGEVFKSTDLTEGWDGNEMPIGIYSYKIIVANENYFTEELSGSIELIR